MQEAYARARKADISARVAGIDMLNRVSQTDAQWLRDLRSMGVCALHDIKPIRRGLMKLGLGV